MDVPIPIILMSPFSVLGPSGAFHFHFPMKIKPANRIAPDGTPRFAASHLGVFCLPMSYKKDDRLIWVKIVIFTTIKINTCKRNCLFIPCISASGFLFP